MTSSWLRPATAPARTERHPCSGPGRPLAARRRDAGAPTLPRARGALSDALLRAVAREPGHRLFPVPEATDPAGDDDEALALYLCYELHYQGLSGVDEGWEWEPSLLAFRAALEARLVDQLRSQLTPAPIGAGGVEEAIRATLAADSAPSASAFLAERGTRRDFLELAVHRSAYQLKEADPHTWGIPRLSGDAKAAMVRIQYEEYGEGQAAAMHSRLFAVTMAELGLDPSYGAYLELIPGVTLTGVNVISLFGLHRRWRGALVGHLAGFEMTSVGPNERLAAAGRRLGVPEQALAFFEVHVEADEEHQLLAEHALAAGLATAEPQLAPDIVFGTAALCHVEGRWAEHVTSAWGSGRSSLLQPPG